MPLLMTFSGLQGHFVMMMVMMVNSFVGYESDHLSYGSLPRQCVSPWFNYASDSEGRRFNSLGRCVGSLDFSILLLRAASAVLSVLLQQ